MVARALLDELTFGTISRRERPVASHVPYTRHVDDNIIKTRDGLVMTVLKLDGYSFETSDMSEVNARLLGRNDVVRTLANSRFALTAHIIRREVQPRIESTFDNVLCRELDERYDAALSKRRMFVNDLYLTIIRRPLQGQAGTFDAMLT
ncbi:MAG: type VI secretion protein, partial [Bradyrhizobium sp.]